MSDVDDHFCELMRRIGEGSEDAAWELVDQYGESIRRAVRRALSGRLRSLFDSQDFVQVVWSSFFRARSGADRFNHPAELAAFLAAMAHNKVAMEIRRRFSTEKYNIRKERSLGDPQLMEAGPTQQAAAPVDAAIARERWDRMLMDQPPHYRQIIQLRLQRHTHAEIAAKIGIAESTVRRFLDRLSRQTVP